MANVYIPDRWVELKITSPGTEEVRKILGGWMGGYTDPSHWRLNSGIEQEINLEDFVNFIGYTGSIYSCRKSAQGMNMIMLEAYEALTKVAEKQGAKIEIITRTFD